MSKNFQLLQRTSSGQDVFQAPRTAPASVLQHSQMQTLAKGEESQQKPWKSRSLGMPGLGLIEKDRGSRSQEVFRNGHSGTDPHAITQREEIKLVQRLFLAPGQRSPRTVLFSGVEADGGCASICARVGYTLAAQTDGPVCVVDTNFRSPSLHQYFGVDNFRGLAEAILQPGPLQEFAQRLPERGLLWVIPSGFKVAKLSFSAVPDRLRSRMAELRAAFKFVVVHSSPLTADTDSVLLSRCTDGVVLVVEANSTRRETARRVKENLEVADVPVLGVVLNNRTFPIPEALYRRL